MYNSRARQRIALGLKYLVKYTFDDLLGAHRPNRSPLKPVDILCEITYRCNLKCPTCFRWTSAPDENELTVDEWNAVIVKLKKWLGTFSLSFGGGEPFLKDGFVDIVRFASAHGIITSAVSNGSLIDEIFAKKIISSGLDSLSLSLNSLNPNVHNATRGSEASFDDVMRAITNLRKRGKMRLTISATIMEENIRELPKIVEFVVSEGLDGINFQPLMEAGTFPVFDATGGHKEFPEGKLYKKPGRETLDITGIFDEIISMKEKGYPINNSFKHLSLISVYLKNHNDSEFVNLPCNIGPKNFFLDPFGNVRICSIMEPIGSIKDDVPESIWSSDKAKIQRELIRDCRKACKLLNCNFKLLDANLRAKRILKSLKKQ
ncbi:MAG: radical SAM protein [Deltaproteobacteria bacterium]|nr:radical SAM protein [Deltaproteobacteria bacterium]